jgi:8-hydroxy-5-deazaflavin:NADPH oxidoreductase
VRIGVIGSGQIGGTLAKLLAQSGHEVAVANSRGPESLAGFVAEAGEGARAATVAEAAGFGDLVIVALPVLAYADLPGDAFAGKVVVDAGNYYSARDGQIAELDDDELTSTELLARELPGARPVKAFNTLNYRVLASEGKPDAPREERVAVFLAGDDAEAKATVSGLIEELGFAAVDNGSLAEGGRRQQPGSAVYNRPMTGREAEAAVGG